MASKLCGFGVVGAEILDFPNECRVIFLAQGPVNEVGELHTSSEYQFVFGGYGSVVLSDWVSMKRTRMDRTAAAISSEEFRKGGVEIVGDEGGDDVLFAIRDDEEMASPDGVEVVLPSGPRVDSWLRAVGTWSLSFYVSVHCLCFQYVSLGLLV